MKIQFQIRGLNANASLRAWLTQQIERLHKFIPVSTADVVLEKQHDQAPGFRAHVHLAVPGPDIHAAARDHTFQAAWLKVIKNLTKQIERRKGRQHHNLRTNRQITANASRWSGAMAGQRA